jgi:hypothetical protein
VALWKSTRFNPLFEKYFLWNLKNRLHHQAGQTTGRVVHHSTKKLSCVVGAGVWRHTMSIAAFPLSLLACHRAYQLPTPNRMVSMDKKELRVPLNTSTDPVDQFRG